MNIILFDQPKARVALKPFSDTRPLAKIRLGITTIEEKWKQYLSGDYSFLTAPYLREKFPEIAQSSNYYINGTVCPHKTLVEAIKQLKMHEQLVQGNTLLAFVAGKDTGSTNYPTNFGHLNLQKISFSGAITQIANKWDIFLHNAKALQEDFQWFQAQQPSQPINDPYTKVYNEAAVFVEPGASIKAAMLNAELGPIYIGKQAVIEEGAILRGPVSVGQGAQIKAGTVVEQATTIGPYAKVGGSISNSVIFGYTNKVHNGFLGNSVIGEWCNLGAGTNTSNLKNNYTTIQVWDDAQEELVSTELQFCGLFMGDHSKCAINTMFNAGTVVGVSANIFGAGFCHKFVPSFTRGGPDSNLAVYKSNKAIETAAIAMQRRDQQLTATDQQILEYLAKEAVTVWIKTKL